MTSTDSFAHPTPEAAPPLCTTSPMTASRLIAAVSGVSALPLTCLLVTVHPPGALLTSTTSWTLLTAILLVNIVHLVGQAVTSAISLKLGAQFGLVAVALQVVPAIFMGYFPLSILGLTASVCALIIHRRHSTSAVN